MPARIRAVRVAVVGHNEWLTFGRVDHIPGPGEIAHADDAWDAPAGGGPVAAVQLAKLAGACAFFTAVGDDGLGRRTCAELRTLGLTVHAAVRDAPTRRAVALIEPGGERTITTLGPRLEPRGDDPLPWEDLRGADAAFVTAGDPDAFRAARGARVLVVTARALGQLADAGVPADAVVGSANDPAERYEAGALSEPPGVVVRTDGARGGTFETADGRVGRYEPAPVSGAGGDAYGGGDSFMAGLTFALARGDALAEALALAARCGAACVGRRGPYAGQLTASDLS
jgi:ribokinase